MTGAELKTLRESLRLPVSWLAKQANVRERTVNYWESGDFEVPDDVVRLLTEIDSSLNQAVVGAIEFVDAQKAQLGTYPEMVHLLRYRTDSELWQFRPDMQLLPTATHAELLSRLIRKLNERCIPTTIQYMTPEAYLKWLGGRDDSEAERANWAAISATQPKKEYNK